MTHKETPILFRSGLLPKVRDGIKTQTRRTRGLDYLNENPDDWCLIRWNKQDNSWWVERYGEILEVTCPYGTIGDLLWVKEATIINRRPELYDGTGVFYHDTIPGDLQPWQWRSPLFMFKRHARTWLEITDVRLQRLHDITNDDAKAEGVPPEEPWGGTNSLAREMSTRQPYLIPFSHLWDDINAGRGPGWHIDPWVWALTYKLTEVPA